MRKLAAVFVSLIIVCLFSPAEARACDVSLLAGDDIQSAIDAALPGQVLCLDPGLYTPGAKIDVHTSLTLRGPQAGVDPRPSASTVRVPGDTLTEAVIDGSGMSGIFVITADNVVLEGLEIRNGSGDLIDSESTMPTAGFEIRYNIIHGSSGDEGVQLRRSNAPSIQYNHVFTTAGDGINVCCGSTLAVVRFNEVHDIASLNAAIYLYDDAAPPTDLDAIIADNLVYDVTANDGIKLGDSNGADASRAGGGILDNIIHDTEQDCITVYTSNVLVDGNECYNSASSNGAIFVDYAVDSVLITGNDIHDNGASTDARTTYGVRVGKDAFPTNVVVTNNTIRRNEEGLTYVFPPGAPPLDARHNFWGSSLGPSGAGGNATSLGDSVSENVLFEPFVDACMVGACPAGGGGDPFLQTLVTIQAVIDDPATPGAVAKDLEKKVLEQVKKAFEEFLKGHPHHLARDLEKAIRELEKIFDDEAYDTTSLQAEVAGLTVTMLADLNNRVYTILGPGDPSFQFTDAAFDQAQSDFFSGLYLQAAQVAKVGANEVRKPDFVADFCAGSPPASYSEFLCEVQDARTQVIALIPPDSDEDSDRKRLEKARDKLTDGLEKLAVVGVKQGTKRIRQAADSLDQLQTLDASFQIWLLTDVTSAMVREFLVDAAASGHDPDGVDQALQLFSQGESARGAGDPLAALHWYEKAAGKGSP